MKDGPLFTAKFRAEFDAILRKQSKFFHVPRVETDEFDQVYTMSKLLIVLPKAHLHTLARVIRAFAEMSHCTEQFAPAFCDDENEVKEPVLEFQSSGERVATIEELGQIFGNIFFRTNQRVPASTPKEGRSLETFEAYHTARNVYQDAVCFMIRHCHDLFEINPFRDLFDVTRVCKRLQQQNREDAKVIERLERDKERVQATAARQHLNRKALVRNFMAWSAMSQSVTNRRTVQALVKSLKDELRQEKLQNRALLRRVEKLEVALELRTFEREVKNIASGEAEILQLDMGTRKSLVRKNTPHGFRKSIISIAQGGLDDEATATMVNADSARRLSTANMNQRGIPLRRTTNVDIAQLGLDLQTVSDLRAADKAVLASSRRPSMLRIRTASTARSVNSRTRAQSRASVAAASRIGERRRSSMMQHGTNLTVPPSFARLRSSTLVSPREQLDLMQVALRQPAGVQHAATGRTSIISNARKSLFAGV